MYPAPFSIEYLKLIQIRVEMFWGFFYSEITFILRCDGRLISMSVPKQDVITNMFHVMDYFMCG